MVASSTVKIIRTRNLYDTVEIDESWRAVMEDGEMRFILAVTRGTQTICSSAKVPRDEVPDDVMSLMRDQIGWMAEALQE